MYKSQKICYNKYTLKRIYQRREICFMRSIITISREFGSGGREIGKKLADDLGIPF